MIVLVDTSIWSLAFRRKGNVLTARELRQLEKLQEIVNEGRVRMLGPVRQELLSGIRYSEQFRRLRDQLRFFQDTNLEVEDYEQAAEIGHRCRTHGAAGGPIDFLLCAVASRRSWAIFTSDRHFERYARHAPIVLV
jgi:predicted nucleic acid-binding protein